MKTGWVFRARNRIAALGFDLEVDDEPVEPDTQPRRTNLVDDLLEHRSDAAAVDVAEAKQQVAAERLRTDIDQEPFADDEVGHRHLGTRSSTNPRSVTVAAIRARRSRPRSAACQGW